MFINKSVCGSLACGLLRGCHLNCVLLGRGRHPVFFFFWYVLALLKAHGDVDCREAVPTVMHGKSLRPLSVWDACDACHMHNLHDSQCLEMQALQPLSCGQRLDDAVKEVPRHGVKAGTPSRAESRSSMSVPSFFTDVGCCSQRSGWVLGLPRFRGSSTQVHP